MSTLTKNLNLVKPELTDAADITAMNENWDRIDTEFENVSTEIDTKMETLSNEVDEKLESLSSDSIVEQNKSNDQKFWVGTKAEYDAIPVKDPNTSYTVTDEVDESELEDTVANLSKRTKTLEARNNVRFESWDATIANNESNTRTCGGTVVAVIVAARYKNAGQIITGIWTPQTSGMENSFYGYLGNEVLDKWNTTVSISGQTVTVTRGGSGSVTYYCTAIVV